MIDAYSWREVLGSVALALALVQVLPYVIGILRGRTRPSLTSYLIWAAVQSLEAAAYVATLGFAPAAWPRIAFAMTGLTVLALATSHGRHTPLTRFEVVSLIAAVGGGLVWLIFGTPFVSLLVSAGVSAIAYATTLRKLWLHPGTEDMTAWLLTSIASLFNVIVLTKVSFAVVLPVGVSLIGSSLVTALIVRARHLEKAEAEA